MDFGEVIGYGPAGPSFWLGPVKTGGEAREARRVRGRRPGGGRGLPRRRRGPWGGGAARAEGVVGVPRRVLRRVRARPRRQQRRGGVPPLRKVLAGRGTTWYSSVRYVLSRRAS